MHKLVGTPIQVNRNTSPSEFRRSDMSQIGGEFIQLVGIGIDVKRCLLKHI